MKGTASFMRQVAGFPIMGLTDFILQFIQHQRLTRFLKSYLKENSISSEESEKYKTAVMAELCKLNHKRGWTQQFHVGALRNNNARMFRQLGPDTGWDSIGVPQDAL